jgi:hypothetical protein
MGKKLKKVIVFGLILIAILAFFMYSSQITDLFNSFFGKGEDVVLKPVALVEQIKDNVKLKRSVSTEWNSAEAKKKLGIKDALSTGDQSFSLVKFNNGFDFSLGEKSLVVIEDPKEDNPNVVELLMESGTGTFNNDLNDSAVLRVRSGDTVTEVQGKADITMIIDGKTKHAKLFIRKGKAKVKDELNNETIVTANEFKDFSTQPPEPTPPPPSPPVAEVKPEPEPAPEPVKEEPKPARVLTKDDIYKTLSKYGTKLNTCYDNRIDFVKGSRLLMTASIENTGKVLALKTIKSEIKDKLAESCLKRTVKAIKFPEFDGEPVNEKIYLVFSNE